MGRGADAENERGDDAERNAEKNGFHAIGDDHSHNIIVRGAERGADGDFLTAGDGFGEHEVGDIGASNEENESDGTEKEEQSGTNINDELFAQRKDGGAPALVIFGIELLKASGDGAELGLCLADINGGLEAGNDEIVVIAANGALLAGPGEGHPQT